MIEISSSRETNNSNLWFFLVTLMIYGENVRVPNFFRNQQILLQKGNLKVCRIKLLLQK